jgi:hypothetical protein
VSYPAAPKVAPSYTKGFFIDTIVHIDVLNGKLPSKRLILSQRFGVHAMLEGFIQWEVFSLSLLSTNLKNCIMQGLQS